MLAKQGRVGHSIIVSKINYRRHKPAKRQIVTVNFTHESHKVCKKTFLSYMEWARRDFKQSRNEWP